MQNMQLYEPYLLQETAIVEFVNTKLNYNNLENSLVTHSNITFEIIDNETEVTVYVHYPYIETLVLKIQNNRIYDYSVSR